MTITKPDNEATTVHEIIPGTIVISAITDKHYFILCSGRTEKRVHLSGGLYVLQLETGCRINGNGWTVNSVVQRSSQQYVRLPIIDIPPLNLTTPVFDTIMARHLENPHWKVLGELRNVKIPDVDKLLQDDDVIWGSNAGNVSWITMLGSIAIIVVLVYVIIVLYKKRIIRMPTIGGNRPRQEDVLHGRA